MSDRQPPIDVHKTPDSFFGDVHGELPHIFESYKKKIILTASLRQPNQATEFIGFIIANKNNDAIIRAALEIIKAHVNAEFVDNDRLSEEQKQSLKIILESLPKIITHFDFSSIDEVIKIFNSTITEHDRLPLADLKHFMVVAPYVQHFLRTFTYADSTLAQDFFDADIISVFNANLTEHVTAIAQTLLGGAQIADIQEYIQQVEALNYLKRQLVDLTKSYPFLVWQLYWAGLKEKLEVFDLCLILKEIGNAEIGYIFSEIVKVSDVLPSKYKEILVFMTQLKLEHNIDPVNESFKNTYSQFMVGIVDTRDHEVNKALETLGLTSEEA